MKTFIPDDEEFLDFQRKRGEYRRQECLESIQYLHHKELREAGRKAREKFAKVREKLEAKRDAQIAFVSTADPEDLIKWKY